MSGAGRALGDRPRAGRHRRPPALRLDGRARGPAGQRFVFAPLFANFILGFSDLNRWFLRYPEPRDGYEAAINAHTEEDETHSALFLEDWRELGFDARARVGRRGHDGLVLHGTQTEVFRRYAMRLTRMCVETPDPLVRFGMMEAIETCGHVFFGHTAPLAAERPGAPARRCATSARTTWRGRPVTCDRR